MINFTDEELSFINWCLPMGAEIIEDEDKLLTDSIRGKIKKHQLELHEV